MDINPKENPRMELPDHETARKMLQMQLRSMDKDEVDRLVKAMNTAVGTTTNVNLASALLLFALARFPTERDRVYFLIPFIAGMSEAPTMESEDV